MAKDLFNGHKYTFRKDGDNLLLLDSTDHSHETITFREGLVASGSAPLDIKAGSSGKGLRLYSHNENQVVASLVTSNDDANFFIKRNGSNVFYVYGAAVNTSTFLYAEAHTSTSSYSIAKFLNGEGKTGLRIRSDCRLYSNGSNLWLYDYDGLCYIKLFKSGQNAYLDAASYQAGEPNGNVYLRINSQFGTYNRLVCYGSSATIESFGVFRPGSNNSYTLGSSGYKWSEVWATNGSIQTSDRNEKEHISGSNLGLSFINDLNPVSYKWKDGIRNHYGLIAQEVSESLNRNNVHTDDFAGYISNDMYTRIEYTSGSDDANPDSNTPILLSQSVDYSLRDLQKEGKDITDYTFVSSSSGLRYTEFISPLIKAVQELSAEVTSLKARVTELENK